MDNLVLSTELINYVNWPLSRYLKDDVSSVSPLSICSDKGLTLKTSAFESLYGGQFTLSTQLIKPNYLLILSTNVAPQFL